jgi:hypothetical protein
VSAIPQPPRVHWWTSVRPEPVRPSEAAAGPRWRLREAIREAVTYRSEDLGGEGTCGYLLSGEQLAVIEGAAEEFAAACIELFARPEEET